MIDYNSQEELPCKPDPNKKILYDSKGVKWYKKGLNSSGRRIFLTCALPGCQARAYSIVGDDILVLTKFHELSVHHDYSNKKSKKPTKYKRIKEHNDLYMSNRKRKEENLHHQPRVSKSKFKLYDERQEQTLFQVKQEFLEQPDPFLLFNPPDISNARIVKNTSNLEIMDYKKEIQGLRESLEEILKFQEENQSKLDYFSSLVQSKDPTVMNILTDIKNIKEEDTIKVEKLTNPEWSKGLCKIENKPEGAMPSQPCSNSYTSDNFA
ncbi:unnamed protein product [Moneuplotes crassus]|uniref:Uncharacterized protein n=1 Tax=Euplotes crassus TaxID=5936 RepID=A0AAD1XGK0_EUPCR|nr:unnamed protein product [Moneuplotes crassus]